VTGGGVDRDGLWRASRDNYLLPVEALSLIFRAKVRDYLKKVGLIDQVSSQVWKKDWVVHSEAVGSGESAFKYLAPYIFRVAISNNRILKHEDREVTFEYKESATQRVRTSTLTTEEFIRRFLEHVLPQRFVKVRYYGLSSPANRDLLLEARKQLSESRTRNSRIEKDVTVKQERESLRCPGCGRQMRLIEHLKPNSREPP
jgi:hypothetical protein